MVRALKLLLIPFTMFFICKINKSIPILFIGLSFGLCYIVIFLIALFIFFSNVNDFSLSHIFSKYKENLTKREFLIFFKLIKNGASSGFQIIIETIYSFIIFIILSRINYNVQSIYYILSHIIYLFSTLPFAVSLAISFKSASNGLTALENTEAYCKKLLYILILVTLFISSLILIFKSEISTLFPVLQSILTKKNYLVQYNIGYSLIPIIVLLEIPRFILIGLLRGLKITFAPMLANAGIFFIFSLPFSAFFLVKSSFPVLCFLLGEVASLCIIVIILSRIYARIRRLYIK